MKSRKHNRHSIRLKGFDYSNTGAYFITICTKYRECLFGEIKHKKMELNDLGQIVLEEWLNTQEIRPNIKCDIFVVMPDHFHGIIEILEYGVYRNTPHTPRTTFIPNPHITKTRIARFESPSKNLGSIIRGFKGAATKKINLHRNTPGQSVWQRDYYEHIIRNEIEYRRIHQYILKNPEKWQ